MIDRDSYGVNETNPLTMDVQEWQDHLRTFEDQPVYWTEPGLKIVRLRLLSDPGFPLWDVSYCHGVLNGQNVRVRLPFDQLPKKNMLRAIVEHAKRDKVFAKGLGILDNISTLN